MVEAVSETDLDVVRTLRLETRVARARDVVVAVTGNRRERRTGIRSKRGTFELQLRRWRAIGMPVGKRDDIVMGWPELEGDPRIETSFGPLPTSA